MKQDRQWYRIVDAVTGQHVAFVRSWFALKSFAEAVFGENWMEEIEYSRCEEPVPGPLEKLPDALR